MSDLSDSIEGFIKDDIKMEKLFSENKQTKEMEDRYKYKAAQLLFPSKEQIQQDRQQLDLLEQMRLSRKKANFRDGLSAKLIKESGNSNCA